MFLTSLREVLSYHVLTGLAVGQTEFLYLLRLSFWRQPKHFWMLADIIDFTPLTSHLPTSVNSQQLLKLKQHRWIKLQKKWFAVRVKIRENENVRVYWSISLVERETVTPTGSIMNYSQKRDIAPLLGNWDLWRYIVGGGKSFSFFFRRHHMFLWTFVVSLLVVAIV